MKQEERSAQSRRKILDAARKEFAKNGYMGGSTNAICESSGVPKGVLFYHYRDKEDIYLACARTVVDAVWEHMEGQTLSGTPEECVTGYFVARARYWDAHPDDYCIFQEIMLNAAPPLPDVRLLRERFDEQSMGFLRRILRDTPLRPGVTLEDIAELFKFYQAFANRRAAQTAAEREHFCRYAIDLLFYGTVVKKD